MRRVHENLDQNKDVKLFQAGTFSWWEKLLNDVGPKMINYVNSTLVPAQDAILIQAFGNEYNYKRIGADMTPIFKEGGKKDLLAGFEFKTLFDVDIIKDFQGDESAVEQDEQFFIQSLRRIRGIQVDEKSASMDTEKGRVVFSVKILLGSV